MRIVAVFLTVLSVTTAASNPVPVGINLSGVAYWTSEQPFSDEFRHAASWRFKGTTGGKSDADPSQTDALGNLLQLRPGQIAEAIVFLDGRLPIVSEPYVLSFEGVGDVRVTNARVVSRSKNEIRFFVKEVKAAVVVQVWSVDPSRPVKKFRLLQERYARANPVPEFRPEFLARWNQYRVIRYMGWMQTNDNEQKRWSDRPQPEGHSYEKRGVPVEVMVRAANATRTDPWFTLPHGADDDYVRRFAQYVKDNLAPERTAFVELSNEVWNGGYQQSPQMATLGLAKRLSENFDEARERAYAERSVEVFRIWRTAFSDRKRLVCVLSAQAANIEVGKRILQWKHSAKEADALAIAPYFGYMRGTPESAEATLALGVEGLMQGLASDVDAVGPVITEYRALANKHKLRLVAYEAGQHLVGVGGAENQTKLTELFIAANRHPKMKGLYAKYLGLWSRLAGDLIVHLGSVGWPSKWGSWGILETEVVDPATQPKFLALQEFIAAQKANDRVPSQKH